MTGCVCCRQAKVQSDCCPPGSKVHQVAFYGVRGRGSGFAFPSCSWPHMPTLPIFPGDSRISKPLPKISRADLSPEFLPISTRTTILLHHPSLGAVSDRTIIKVTPRSQARQIQNGKRSRRRRGKGRKKRHGE